MSQNSDKKPPKHVNCRLVVVGGGRKMGKLAMTQRDKDKRKVVFLDGELCGEIRVWVPPGVTMKISSVQSPAGGVEYILRADGIAK